MFTPWNQALFEKYPCPGIPVVQLLQATCKQNHHIPLGPAPCNTCPVEFPDSPGTPLGIQQGWPIPLGPVPLNDICSLKFKNMERRISLADTSIFQRYQTIPLGPAPWNDICSLKISEHGEPHFVRYKYISTVSNYSTGALQSFKKVYSKAPSASCWWSFFIWLFWRMTRAGRQKIDHELKADSLTKSLEPL